MAKRKYSYGMLLLNRFDDRYKQYQRLMWKHPKDINELLLFVFLWWNPRFRYETLFRLKYICKTRYVDDGKKIPDDVIEYVDNQWKEHGYPLISSIQGDLSDKI
jgi:hypothetical protein